IALGSNSRAEKDNAIAVG
ncbi:hypothetical protein FSF97_026955, partial [Escherichia coli]|nr:hypothetical protein [Escherichia coli]